MTKPDSSSQKDANDGADTASKKGQKTYYKKRLSQTYRLK